MAFRDRVKEGMESGLEQAIRIVQPRVSKFEHQVLAPLLKSGRQYANEHPTTALLFGIFALLSFVPVTSFLGFAIVVTVALVILGLWSALIASTMLIVAAAGLLTVILGAALLTSLCLTTIVISLSVVMRLGQHLAHEGDLKKGITGWAQETRGRLNWESPGPVVSDSDHVKRELNAPGALSGSQGWHGVANGPDGQS